MMRDPDAGGWKRLPDGDSYLKGHEHHKGKILKKLYIYKNQLMYDIEAQTEIIQSVRKTDEKATDDNNIIERFKGQFDRWINKYVEKVKERLIIILLEERNYSKGNELKDWDEKELLFIFPHWWDDTAWNPLCDAIHSYIVNSVLSEYLKLTLTSKDPVTIDKLNDAQSDWDKMRVLQSQNKPGSVRRTLHQLGF